MVNKIIEANTNKPLWSHANINSWWCQIFGYSSLMIILGFIVAIYFTCHKLHIFNKFQAYKVFMENKISKKMKMFWYNHGGGFTSRDFNAFCELYGITCQLTNSSSPQKN
jgi:hypothetical protein